MLRDELLEKFDPKGPERCGLVLESGEVIELENIHDQPGDAFAFPFEELNRPGVVATWHTHPVTGPNLSVEDLRMFTTINHLTHFIISGSNVWCYFVVNDVLICDHGDEDHSPLWRIGRTPPGPDQG